jgi:hypothetical protein
VHTDRGASALYLLDAGGNVAELVANDHLDNDSDARFGPDSLLEIAEIGVSTADTGATSAAIQDALSAEILWGGREGWLLTAIGDDQGVVIVTPTGVAGSQRGSRPGRCRRPSSQPPRAPAMSLSPRVAISHPRRRGVGVAPQGSNLITTGFAELRRRDRGSSRRLATTVRA